MQRINSEERGVPLPVILSFMNKLEDLGYSSQLANKMLFSHYSAEKIEELIKNHYLLIEKYNHESLASMIACEDGFEKLQAAIEQAENEQASAISLPADLISFSPLLDADQESALFGGPSFEQYEFGKLNDISPLTSKRKLAYDLSSQSIDLKNKFETSPKARKTTPEGSLSRSESTLFYSDFHEVAPTAGTTCTLEMQPIESNDFEKQFGF